MNYFKKIIILSFVLLALFLPLTFSWRQAPELSAVVGKTKPYYSGQAIYYNNKTIIASVNMDKLNLFVYHDKKLDLAAVVEVEYTVYPPTDRFNDVELMIKNGRLMMYLVDGPYLHEFDISNPYRPKENFKYRSAVWDWYLGLTKFEDKLVTIGLKEVSVWNKEMVLVDSFKIKNVKEKNIAFSPHGGFIFNVNDNELSIFDTASRSYVRNIDFYANEDHERLIYNDDKNSLIYIVDDDKLRAIDFSGQTVKSFDHIANFGYDVVPSTDDLHLYFSDGIGVVKVNKDTMAPVDWEYTTAMGDRNGWAMGLALSADPQGEKLVVFNNGSILVMDRNLELLASIAATDIDLRSDEDLWLSMDKSRAARGAVISLRGGGFNIGEELEISIANSKFFATANNEGRFVKQITVPDIDPQRLDIKVIGKDSALSYSISFTIE